MFEPTKEQEGKLSGAWKEGTPSSAKPEGKTKLPPVQSSAVRSRTINEKTNCGPESLTPLPGLCNPS